MKEWIARLDAAHAADLMVRNRSYDPGVLILGYWLPTWRSGNAGSAREKSLPTGIPIDLTLNRAYRTSEGTWVVRNVDQAGAVRLSAVGVPVAYGQGIDAEIHAYDVKAYGAWEVRVRALGEAVSEHFVLPAVARCAFVGRRRCSPASRRAGFDGGRSGITSGPGWLALRDIVTGSRAVAREASRLTPALVHCRGEAATVMARWARLPSTIRLLCDVRGLFSDERVETGSWRRGSLLDRAVRRMEAANLQRADWAGVLTRHAAETLRRRRPSLTSLRVIPTCADVSTFRPRAPGHKPEFGLVYSGSVGTWYMAEEMVAFARLAAEVVPGPVLFLTQEPRELRRLGATPDWAEIHAAEPGAVAEVLRRGTALFFFIRPIPSKRASCPTKFAGGLASGYLWFATAGLATWTISSSKRVSAFWPMAFPRRAIRPPHAASGVCSRTPACPSAAGAWLPVKLEWQVARFDSEPGLGLVHCGVAEVDDRGRQLRARPDGMEGWVSTQMLLFRRGVILGGGSVAVIRRAIFLEVSGFDEALSTSADWDLYYRVARRYPVGFVPEVLVRYRVHSGNLHRNEDAMTRDMLAAYARVFSEQDPELQRSRRWAYGRLHAMLAGLFFQAGEYRRFARRAAASVAARPGQVGYFAGYPVRALRRCLSGSRVG